MESSELDKRVEEEAEKAIKAAQDAGPPMIHAARAVVRPLVEECEALKARVVELETTRAGEGARVDIRTVLAAPGEGARADIRAALAAAPEEGTLRAAERVVRALKGAEDKIAALQAALRATEQALTAARDKVEEHERRIIAQEQQIRALQDERVKALAASVEAGDRIEGLQGELAELRRVRDRYSASLATEREGRLRAEQELRDAEAGMRAVWRMADRARVEVVS